jgi:hypothetical protein
MAKTFTEEVTAPPQAETKKQRKKQAKREAKIMLKLEQARKNVQKAEQKVARAQSNLEASNAHVHELEGRLSQLQTPEEGLSHLQAAEEPHDSTSSNGAGTAEQNVEVIPQDESVSPSGQVASMLPAEGRDDVSAVESNDPSPQPEEVTQATVGGVDQPTAEHDSGSVEDEDEASEDEGETSTRKRTRRTNRRLQPKHDEQG